MFYKHSVCEYPTVIPEMMYGMERNTLFVKYVVIMKQNGKIA